MNRYLTCLTLLLALGLFSGSCFANKQENRQLISGSEGFTVSLLPVNQTLLLLELKQMQHELWNQQSKLLSLLTEKSFSLADAIITLIAPGGLIYIINKQRHLMQTKGRLNTLNSDLLLLHNDVMAMNHSSAIEEGSQPNLQLALAR